MSPPFGWGLVVIAVVATGVALWAGPNLPIALPAAVVAIGAATLLLAEVAIRSPAAPRRPTSGPPRRELGEIRTAFASGELGRERLVALLDRLEPVGPSGSRPTRTPEELRTISRLGTDEFREYVRERLSRLEATT